MSIHYFGSGGVRHPGLRNFLKSGHSGNPLNCLGDLGGDPLDWSYPWQIPTQGGFTSGGNSYKAIHGG